MELFEKINRAFGGWYEGLFGGSEDVRPRDILRKILTSLEEHRKEGFDSKVYVPNQFILEISVDDEEEKEYLLSFLDREELETAIRRYCQQNNYHIRGALDFTIKELESPVEGARREKVRVRCRYDSKLAATRPPAPKPADEPKQAALPREEENPTVYEVAQESESGTVPAVASARLEISTPGKPPYDYPIARGAITIGRSSRAGNDVVLDLDGLASRRHARIEMEADGRFTVYDLDTTNGTRVNGRKVDNRMLATGDEIGIGATRLVFRQEESDGQRIGMEADDSNGHAAAGPVGHRDPIGRISKGARLVLIDAGREIDEYVLASETLIGRGVTSDIVLNDPSVATRHARVTRGEPFMLSPLSAGVITEVNGAAVEEGAAAQLASGDVVTLGKLALRFEGDTR